MAFLAAVIARGPTFDVSGSKSSDGKASYLLEGILLPSLKLSEMLSDLPQQLRQQFLQKHTVSALDLKR
jgi:hypothetical protein